MKDRDVQLVGQIVEAARQPTGSGSKGRHSLIYETLWGHYDELLPELAPPRMPNWAAVAERLATAGLLDGSGKPAKPPLVRNTWWKVCRDKAAGPKPKKKAGRRATTTTTVTMNQRPELTPPFLPIDDDTEDKPPGGKFRAIPSRPRT